MGVVLDYSIEAGSGTVEELDKVARDIFRNLRFPFSFLFRFRLLFPDAIVFSPLLPFPFLYLSHFPSLSFH